MSEAPERESKTEEATPRKLEQAREKGEGPKTQDLTSFATLATSAAVVLMAGGWLSRNMAAQLTPFLSHPQDMHLDGDDSVNPNTAFHDALVTAAHNPVLAQVHASSYDLFHHLPFYWPLLDSAEVRSAREWRHELARRWHRQILQALEQRDPDEAGGAMFQHLDVMEKDLLARLRLNGNEASHDHPSLAPRVVSPTSA